MVRHVFGEGPPGAASIAGLHEAGAETAYSLVRPTCPLLGANWSIDKLAGMKVLIRLRDAAAKAFSRGCQATRDATWATEKDIETWTRDADETTADREGER